MMIFDKQGDLSIYRATVYGPVRATYIIAKNGSSWSAEVTHAGTTEYLDTTRTLAEAKKVCGAHADAVRDRVAEANRRAAAAEQARIDALPTLDFHDMEPVHLARDPFDVFIYEGHLHTVILTMRNNGALREEIDVEVIRHTDANEWNDGARLIATIYDRRDLAPIVNANLNLRRGR